MTDAQSQQLGRIISDARHKKGLSYSDLATASATDRAWLHRLENGHWADPDPALLTRVTEALGIDPARIDRASSDHLASSMPGMRTYFRSKEKLPLAALKEVEAAVAEIRAKYNTQPDSQADGSKEVTP